MNEKLEHMSGADGCHQQCPACHQEVDDKIKHLGVVLNLSVQTTTSLHVEVPADFPALELEGALQWAGPVGRLKDGIPVDVQPLQDAWDDGHLEDENTGVRNFIEAVLLKAEAVEANTILFHL